MGTSEWLVSAPLVIAHRGASAVAPENTLAGFERAVDLGAEAIELDAKHTLDGVVVALHDQTLARTTGAPGRPGDYAWVDLRRLDAGSWMGTAFAGTPIPSLDEVLEAVGRRVLVNIELTEYQTDQKRLVSLVVAAVRSHALTGRVLFSSFQSSALREAERWAPEIPRARLLGPTWLGFRDRVPQPRSAIAAEHPHVSIVSRSRIQKAHQGGRRVHVFTVNDPVEMNQLWSMGADGLITDVPDVCRRSRDRTGSGRT